MSPFSTLARRTKEQLGLRITGHMLKHMSRHMAGLTGAYSYPHDCVVLGVFQRLEHYGVRFSSSRFGTPSLFRLLLQSVYMRRLPLSQELV